MARRTLELFREPVADARLMDVPDGYRPSTARSPDPAGSPTVMLYAHYDVQPAPMKQGWTSDPLTPTRKDDGRIYGRGVADDKGGLAMHLGMLRAFDGQAAVHRAADRRGRGGDEQQPRGVRRRATPSSSTSTCS